MWLAWFLTLVSSTYMFARGTLSLQGGIASSTLLGARIDMLSLLMLNLVLFLGAIILRFSRNYLAGDAQQGRFFQQLVFTLCAVVFLIISPGLVQFFLAWVLMSMGLHRLLLYFPDRLGTLLSARKKLVISRAGDVCLLLGFAGIYQIFGTQDFGRLFAMLDMPHIQQSLADTSWIAWCVVSGAILKSAQFPFHTWLPDTMGAPTPVSALMHAGIINAGGLLVIRLSPVLVTVPNALYFLAIVGAVTALFASMVMLTQTSVKRSLAYSTIAQMGFMLLQCGLGAFHLALLHIIAHSLYKGHAFLSCGNAVSSIQRMHTTAWKHSPLVSLSRLAGVFASATAIVLGLNVVSSDFMTAEKPGMLVFSVILIMAVTHFILKQMQNAHSKRSLCTACAWGSGFAVLYYSLALGTQQLMAMELPRAIGNAFWFESVLATILGVLLGGSLFLQYSHINPLPLRLRHALYVHALNGFYINTLANGLARAMRIVPAKR